MSNVKKLIKMTKTIKRHIKCLNGVITIAVKIVGRINLSNESAQHHQRVRTYTISDALAEEVKSSLIAGEDMISFDGGKSWYCTAVVGSDFQKELVQFLEAACIDSKYRLAKVRDAYRTAHIWRQLGITVINGCILVENDVLALVKRRKTEWSSKHTANELFAYDVNTNSKISL